MIYKLMKGIALKLFALDATPPEAPAGADHDTVRVFRAEPEFLNYRLIRWVVLSLVFLIFGGLFTLAAFLDPDGQMPLVVPLLLDSLFFFISMMVYFSIRLDYDMRTYIVTDKSLRIREGAVLIREMTLTYVNVQNVKVEQGPLQRILGFKDLVVETAGGGGQVDAQGHRQFSYHTGVLRGIADAEGLRDLIQARMEHRPEPTPPPEINVATPTDHYREILAEIKRLRARLATAEH